MLWNAALSMIYFLVLWIGSGFVVSRVERIAKNFGVSSFFVSFLVLGFFTSFPEISIGINSVVNGFPQIFVGNLIGASLVLFLLAIPFLAIAGHKIAISRELVGNNMVFGLLVVAMPSFLVLDGTYGLFDALICVCSYFALLISIQERENKREVSIRKIEMSKITLDMIVILLGLIAIFVSGRGIVEQVSFFAQALGLSSFLISLLVVSIGTNIPELSIAARSIFMKKTQVAFGDYVGSAAFNTFLMGGLAYLNRGSVNLSDSYIISTIFMVVGLVVFYLFSRSGRSISRNEGVVLLLVYVVFVISELVLGLK